MKVHVPKKTLADTLAHVERIIPSRSSNPGLSLLRIDTRDDGIELSGSNMDVDIRAKFAADAQGEGSYAVPAHVFSQVVRALPDDLVELEFGEKELDLSSGTFATKLQLMAPSSAPQLVFPTELDGALDASLLAKALSSVRYAAAVADYQAVFRGVKLELGPQTTRAVATDGFRLAYYHLDVATGLEGDVVVPGRSVDELTRILGEGEARLGLSEGQLSVQSGGFHVNLKLMDGTFPDYERIIPQSFPVSITVDAPKLAEAVSRVALMADKTANNRVDLFVRDGVVQITAEGTYGRSQESLDVLQEGTDPEIALAYNAKYLVDALGPAAGDVRLSFSGGGPSSAPSVVADLGDPSYLAMVVPLRTG
ncbi:MAG: DNA polymerase III subunit beta [Deinococcales bacterium]